MDDTPRYSLKKYLLLLVLSPTIGMIITVSLLLYLGIGWQGTLIVFILSFPLWLFGILYGFYKGLVKYYGLNGSEKLFLMANSNMILARTR